jgi:mono/diheme cytochrome c family protein
MTLRVGNRMNGVRRKSALLFAVLAIAFVAAGCGRATEDQIDQALGITPTATLSAEQVAAAGAAASATAAGRVVASSSPGAVALGDVTRGARQFDTWCSACHGPGGSAPDILSPGSPGAKLTADSLQPLIRDGAGHTPPGPYKPTEISNSQIADIAAYIRSKTGG